MPVYKKNNEASGEGGSSGVTSHPQLSGLGYTASGHTGFASEEQLNEVVTNVATKQNILTLNSGQVPMRQASSPGQVDGAISVASIVSSNSLAMRDTGGRLSAADATSQYQVINKGQFDTAIGDINSILDTINGEVI